MSLGVGTLKESQRMAAYQFYRCDSKKDYHLCGILPERRKDPERITQASILNWGRKHFGIKCNPDDIFFIQVDIDRQTGRVLHPCHKVKFYKIFYKNYELKKREFLGVLTERRRNCRGKNLVESGTRWARLEFGHLVRDQQAIFVVPDELDLPQPQKRLERQPSSSPG